MIAGSVADNLGLARPGLTTQAMWEALTVACAADMVRALPDGLHQWLGSDGARLSGGQRRRLAIARALLAGRPWLVLDEPSEGLDAQTERNLISRLDAWLGMTGTGLLLISHRPAMGVLADTVVEIRETCD
jgi:ATP-binding cassette subfamily C protein CydC